jgi:AcrR family transcriptional regulator
MTTDDRRMDPRTRRTLTALRQALATLLEEKPLSHITVSELCRVAGIHRTTFYKHFDIVPEVAATVVQELGRAVVGPRRSDDGGLTYRAWLTAVLEHAAEHRRLYARLVGSGGDPALIRAVAWQFQLRTDRFLRESGAAAERDIPALSRMLGYGFYGLVEATLDHDDPVDVDASVERFVAALPAPLVRALDAPPLGVQVGAAQQA